jgi:hypothetical protein
MMAHAVIPATQKEETGESWVEAGLSKIIRPYRGEKKK